MHVVVTGARGPMGFGLRRLQSEHELEFWDSSHCDLTDARATLEAMARAKPDAVIHLAAKSGGAHLSRRVPAAMFRDNMLMALNVLEAAVATDVGRVGMSISTACYPTSLVVPATEDDLFDGPVTADDYAYAYAKRSVVPLLRAYEQQFGLQTFSMVVNGIVGPGMNFRNEESVMVASLIRKFSEAGASGAVVEIWGDGSALREYTSGSDLAKAALWCLDHQETGSVLNIGTNERVTVSEVAENLRIHFGLSEDQVRYVPGKGAGKDTQLTDNRRFVGLSGFVYEPFVAGLDEAAAWYTETIRSGGWIRL